MLSTSTRCWSRFTQTLVSRARLWASWTHLSTTSSRESPTRPRNWATTTVDQPSRLARSRPRSVSCCQESWLNTPSLKAQRLSPSIPHPSKCCQKIYSNLTPRPFSRPAINNLNENLFSPNNSSFNSYLIFIRNIQQHIKYLKIFNILKNRLNIIYYSYMALWSSGPIV